MGGVIGMQVTDTLMLHPLYSFARMPRMAQGHTFTTWPRTPPDVLLLRKISECAVLLWEELYHWEQTLHVGVPYHNPLAFSNKLTNPPIPTGNDDHELSLMGERARLMKKKADLLQIITRHLASPGGCLQDSCKMLQVYIINQFFLYIYIYI